MKVLGINLLLKFRSRKIIEFSDDDDVSIIFCRLYSYVYEAFSIGHIIFDDIIMTPLFLNSNKMQVTPLNPLLAGPE